MKNPIKRAHTSVEIYPLIRDRWSPRAFSAKRVAPDQFLKLMEAARWAASCFNEQPWRFLVATIENPEEHAKALACLTEANQEWAKHAPVLMLTVVKSQFTVNGKPNRWCEHDLGLAMGNLTTQASADGLVLHHMAGILPDRIREVYGIPEGFHPMTAVALGYEGDPASLEPEWALKSETEPRTRKPLADLFFHGTWGDPWAGEE